MAGSPGTSPAAPGSTQAAPAAPQQPSWLQGLRESAGIDLGTDEKAALTQLTQRLQQLQQLQQLAPYVASYQQHAPAFSRYLQEQQRAAQQPAPVNPQQPRSWKQQIWNPPEFNRSWLGLLKRDEQGNLTTVPGAPPDVLPRYQAYQQYRQEFAEKFLDNPIDTMEPIIQQIVRAEAQQLVQQSVSQQRDQQFSNNFVEQNTSWLYERDAMGNVAQQQIFNPTTGQYSLAPVMSPWGQRFTQYVQQEFAEQQRRGYMDVARQQQVAMAMIQRDYAIAQLRAGPAPPQSAPQNPRVAANEAIMRANNPAPAQPVAQGNTIPAGKTPNKLNLRELMAQEMRQNGITTETLNNT